LLFCLLNSIVLLVMTWLAIDTRLYKLQLSHQLFASIKPLEILCLQELAYSYWLPPFGSRGKSINHVHRPRSEVIGCGFPTIATASVIVLQKYYNINMIVATTTSAHLVIVRYAFRPSPTPLKETTAVLRVSLQFRRITDAAGRRRLPKTIQILYNSVGHLRVVWFTISPQRYALFNTAKIWWYYYIEWQSKNSYTTRDIRLSYAIYI